MRRTAMSAAPMIVGALLVLGCTGQDTRLICQATMLKIHLRLLGSAEDISASKLADSRAVMRSLLRQCSVPVDGLSPPNDPTVVHGRSVNATGDLTLTPLKAALIADDLGRIDRALGPGGGPADVADPYGRTALHWAAALGSAAALRAVAARNPAVDSRDAGGETPLFFAVRRIDRDADTLQALLDLGADPNARVSAEDSRPWLAGVTRTPLLEAVSNGDARDVSILLRAGARVSPMGPGDRSIVSLAERLGDVQIKTLLEEAATRGATEPRPGL